MWKPADTDCTFYQMIQPRRSLSNSLCNSSSLSSIVSVNFPIRTLVSDNELVSRRMNWEYDLFTALRNESFARDITECIILRLLPLRQADLDKWQADPEEFIKDEDGEKWKFDVRVSITLAFTSLCPKAEALLTALCRSLPERAHEGLRQHRLADQRISFEIPE